MITRRSPQEQERLHHGLAPRKRSLSHPAGCIAIEVALCNCLFASVSRLFFFLDLWPSCPDDDQAALGGTLLCRIETGELRLQQWQGELQWTALRILVET